MHGLGDGLWVWFGANVDEVNRLLDPLSATRILPWPSRALPCARLSPDDRPPPSFLPGTQGEALSTPTDSYLRLFVQEGMITPPDGVGSQAKLVFRDFLQAPAITESTTTRGCRWLALVSAVSSGCSFMTWIAWI